MNVGELKKMLEKYSDDIEILNERYSDMQIVNECDWYECQGVDKDGWVMRSHATMSAENKLAEKTYLCLTGN